MKKYKKKSIILLFIPFLLLSFLALTNCSNSKDENIFHYTCPMHPQIKMEEEGQCPICKMDLVPVEKTQNHKNHKDQTDHKNHKTETSENGIHINPRYVQNIGVITEPAKKQELYNVIQAYGKVAHDRELWTAENEYLEALKLGNRSLIQAAKNKLSFLGLSSEMIESLRRTRKPDMELHYHDGMPLSLFEAYINQTDAHSIKVGQKIDIYDQKGDFLAKGSVQAVRDIVNLQTGTVRLLVKANQALDVIPNSFVQFQIKIPLGENLSVPRKAILFNGDHNMVYIQKEEGHFIPRTVTLGESTKERVAILDGLKEGENVIVNGHFLIDSESQIQMGGMGGHQH